MPIQVTTVYTKEKLRAFIKYAASTKKVFWCIMIICSLLMIALLVLSALLDILSTTLILCAVYLGFIDLVYIFALYLLPRMTLKKSKQLNMVVEYAFSEDSFEMHAHSDYIDDTSTVKYTVLHKAAKKGAALYLYPTRAQAFIVDLTSLSEDEIALLRNILSTHLKPRRLKWYK